MERLWDGTNSQTVLVRFCTKVSEISRGVARNFCSGTTNPKMTLKIRFRACIWGLIAFGGEYEYHDLPKGDTNIGVIE